MYVCFSYNEQAYTTGPSTLRIVLIIVRLLTAYNRTSSRRWPIWKIVIIAFDLWKRVSVMVIHIMFTNPIMIKLSLKNVSATKLRNSINQLLFSLQCVLWSCNWISFQCIDMRRLQGHFIILHWFWLYGWIS